MSYLIVTAEERREKLTERLSTQYATNRISLEEYERLIKYSQNLETDKELTILEKIIEGYEPQQNSQSSPSRDESSSHNSRTESERQTGYRSDNSYNNSAPQNHFSILSSRNTSGQLTAGNFVNILSSHKIIINEEDLINAETVLNFLVLLGNVEILVPENVNVISKVMPLLSEVRIDGNVKSRGGIKDLVITGNTLLGELRIRINKKSKFFFGH